MAATVNETALRAAVERAAGQAFVWGKSDCCTTACAMFEAAWGVKLAWEPPYRNLCGARRFIRGAGGIEALATGIAERSGLVLAADHHGAIGLITEDDRLATGWALAFRFGDKWLVKAQHGIHLLNADARVWGVSWR